MKRPPAHSLLAPGPREPNLAQSRNMGEDDSLVDRFLQMLPCPGEREQGRERHTKRERKRARCICVYIYMYIDIQRGRERERERERERCFGRASVRSLFDACVRADSPHRASLFGGPQLPDVFKIFPKPGKNPQGQDTFLLRSSAPKQTTIEIPLSLDNRVFGPSGEDVHSTG